MIEGLPTYYDENGVIQYDMVAIFNERQDHLRTIFLMREALEATLVSLGHMIAESDAFLVADTEALIKEALKDD